MYTIDYFFLSLIFGILLCIPFFLYASYIHRFGADYKNTKYQIYKNEKGKVVQIRKIKEEKEEWDGLVDNISNGVKNEYMFILYNVNNTKTKLEVVKIFIGICSYHFNEIIFLFSNDVNIKSFDFRIDGKYYIENEKLNEKNFFVDKDGKSYIRIIDAFDNKDKRLTDIIKYLISDNIYDKKIEIIFKDADDKTYLVEYDAKNFRDEFFKLYNAHNIVFKKGESNE